MKQYPLYRQATCGLLLSCSLLALQAVSAQTPSPSRSAQETSAAAGYGEDRPNTKSMDGTKEHSPEAMLQAEPSAAGARITQRQKVIRELERARQRGELTWQDRESTGYQR